MQTNNIITYLHICKILEVLASICLSAIQGSWEQSTNKQLVHTVITGEKCFSDP